MTDRKPGAWKAPDEIDDAALHRQLDAEIAGFETSAAKRELEAFTALDPDEVLPKISEAEHQALTKALLADEIDQAEFNQRAGIDPEAPGKWRKVD